MTPTAGVAVFGMIGVLARFALVRALASTSLAFPWATASVNVVGSFAAGLLLACLERGWLTEAWRGPIALGFLGGFTTFSALSSETLLLFQNGRSGAALVYSLGSLLAGVAAAWAGWALGRP